MDMEEYAKRSIVEKKPKTETIEKLSDIILYYKDIGNEKARLLAKAVIEEVETTLEIDNDLTDYYKTNIHMGEFGVGSRGKGDFYVHSKIAEIIRNTDCQSLVNPTAQDDGGVVKVDDTYYITTAIDGIHSRLSDYPFLAGFHTARATLRDVCVMGANPVAIISDIHLADDGDISKLLDFTAGICAVSELTGVPLVAGSTLRIGGDMVLGSRLVGGVGAVGSSKNIPQARSNAKAGDVILMTEGCGGGTITTTAIYNNYPEVIDKTLNVQFIKASQLLNDYERIENIHAMTDITNGGLIGDCNEINKTTGLGIHLNYDKIKNLIDPSVLEMLDTLDIDALGVSIDSLMIIVDGQAKDEILELLTKNNIKCDVIGQITNTSKTIIEYEDKCEELTPKFREAAYTPIKKVVDNLYDENYDENIKIIDKATLSAINKKNKVVKHIKERKL
ncbi:AIR synthase-related protein [Methanosphaera sp. BMS]|uniref:AIR synthase-related protein n=1 Tax=Methanosphaera sp. BMS TaxID=1789762 RepID=UPI000DC1E06A|nr:AIR synthase-related protein [Methanosphaera sp. BMS]AWX33021.1 hypothetical protein AW729_07890 [Methanosphaera sp. BMS]